VILTENYLNENTKFKQLPRSDKIPTITPLTINTSDAAILVANMLNTFIQSKQSNHYVMDEN